MAEGRVLTAEEIAAYERDGYVVLRGVFDGAQLAALRPVAPRVEPQQAHERDLEARCIVYGNPQTGEDPSRITKLEGLGRLPSTHALSGLFDQCSRHAGLAAMARQLLGARSELMKDKYIFKAKGGGDGFLPHQDMNFMYSRVATEAVNFGIAFDAADASNGALEVCTEPGAYSHMRGRLVLPQTEGVMSYADAAHLRFEHVNTAPGDVVVFSGWLLHQSQSNAGFTRDRNVYYVTYGVSGLADEGTRAPPLYDLYYELYDAWIAAGYPTGAAADKLLGPARPRPSLVPPDLHGCGLPRRKHLEGSS